MDRKSAYLEKLRDPRWQKLRLEVFKRDDWTCQLCGSKDKTLHVHHARYQPDVEPWETDMELLFTACAECHEREHEGYREQLDILLITLGEIGIRTSIDISALIEGATIDLYDTTSKPYKDTTPAERTRSLANALLTFHREKTAAIKDGFWYLPE